MKLGDIGHQRKLTRKQEEWLDGVVEGTWAHDPSADIVNVVGNVACGRTGNMVKFGKITGFLDFGLSPIKSFAGFPREVGKTVYVYNTAIKSLIGSPRTIYGGLDCSQTGIVSLEGLPTIIEETFTCRDTPFAEQHLLQLLKYKQIKRVRVDDGQIDQIINRHLAFDRDILACQDELIDAGFGGAARL